MVAIGLGAEREQKDYQLTRYACYLIVQNGDPTKPVIAAGQTYFAVQTRRQEIADMEAFNRLDEDKQRLLLRSQLKEHNTTLSAAANAAGVEKPVEYAVFQNHGYKGLYGGLDQTAIHKRKGLKKSHRFSIFNLRQVIHIFPYLNKILSNINIDFCLHMVFNTNTNTKLKERFKDGW